MKINEIIREKRKALSLTQEQIAEYLGVSTPAVNKWEKGSTYPDITLLPALARLLKIDLNTLMSFQDDLSNVEIVNFVNEVDTGLCCRMVFFIQISLDLRSKPFLALHPFKIYHLLFSFQW